LNPWDVPLTEEESDALDAAKSVLERKDFLVITSLVFRLANKIPVT
jgi:hypothetical protein